MTVSRDGKLCALTIGNTDPSGIEHMQKIVILDI